MTLGDSNLLFSLLTILHEPENWNVEISQSNVVEGQRHVGVPYST